MFKRPNTKSFQAFIFGWGMSFVMYMCVCGLWSFQKSSYRECLDSCCCSLTVYSFTSDNFICENYTTEIVSPSRAKCALACSFWHRRRWWRLGREWEPHVECWTLPAVSWTISGKTLCLERIFTRLCHRAASCRDSRALLLIIMSAQWLETRQAVCDVIMETLYDWNLNVPILVQSQISFFRVCPMIY